MSITSPSMLNTESIGLRCLVVILLRVDVSDYPSPDTLIRLSMGLSSPEAHLKIRSTVWRACGHIVYLSVSSLQNIH